MSTYKAPADGIFKQNNKADSYSDLWATFGVDISSIYGKLRTSKRLAPTMSTVKTNNDDVAAFVVYKGNIVAHARGARTMILQSYRNPRLSGNWASSAGSLDVGQETDSVVFNNQLLISTGTNIAMTTSATPPFSYDEDWWTAVTSGTALTNAKPHIMDVSLLGQETLFVTDSNRVRYYNTTAGHSTVTLPTHLTACSITTDAFATWVGTYSNSGDAYVYEIYVGEQSGGTPIARRSYRIKGATAILSMDTTDDGVPYLVTDKGKIHTYNGRAFVPVAQFPFANDEVSLAGLSLGDIDDDNLARAIHPKGMRADGKSLLININTNNQLIVDLAANPLDDDDIFENVVVNERSPSGIWEYNIETGVLSHLAPLSNDSTTQAGFHRQQSSGPILITNNPYTRFLTAGRVQSDRTDVYAENPTLTPSGYFITPEIQSDTIQEAFADLVLHKDVLNAETVSIKFRTSKRTGIPKYGAANWTGDTTFVIEQVITLVEVGDLVEIIDGYGAGKMAHVTNIQTSVTTTTFTIDTAIGSNGEVGQVRFLNFKQFNTQDFNRYNSGGSQDVCTWIQFMVVLNGDVTIRKIFNKGNAKTTLG